MGVSLFMPRISFSEILRCPCAVYITRLVNVACSYRYLICLLLPLSTSTSKDMASPTPTQNPLLGMRAVSEIGPDAHAAKTTQGFLDLKYLRYNMTPGERFAVDCE